MRQFPGRFAAIAVISVVGLIGFGWLFNMADVAARPMSMTAAHWTSYHPNLTSISFANASDGWVSAGERTSAGFDGPNGWIFRTTDAGKSWTRYTVHWIAQQMQFISPLRGWAIVASPANCNTGQCSYAVVATNDGGKSWSLQLNGGRCWQIQSLDFITNQEGWTIESSSPCQHGSQSIKTRLMGTTNGGTSWHKAFQPGAVLTSVHFGSPSTGWTAADGLTGGNSSHCRTDLYNKTSMSIAWTKQLTVPGYCDGFVDFASARFGWLLVTNIGACAEAGCVDNRLYRTTSGGTNWTIEKRTWNGNGCGFLQQPHFVSGATGYIAVNAGAGGGCANGGVIITHDGGRHWVRKTPHGLQLGDLSPVSVSNVWGIGCPRGSQPCEHLLHTKNGGAAWTESLIR